MVLHGSCCGSGWLCWWFYMVQGGFRWFDKVVVPGGPRWFYMVLVVFLDGSTRF